MDPMSTGEDAKVEDLEKRRKASIQSQAEGGTDVPEDEPELFPAGLLEGDQLQLKDMLKKGKPVTTTVSVSSASVPLQDGLLNPEKSHWIMMRCVVGNANVVYKREDGEITEAEIRIGIKPMLTRRAMPEAIQAQERGVARQAEAS